MQLSDRIRLDQVNSSVKDVVMEPSFLYGALVSDTVPMLLFRLGSVSLPDVTVETTSAGNIKIQSLDEFEDKIRLPSIKSIGEVSIHISEISRLEPPVIDF